MVGTPDVSKKALGELVGAPDELKGAVGGLVGTHEERGRGNGGLVGTAERSYNTAIASLSLQHCNSQSINGATPRFQL